MKKLFAFLFCLANLAGFAQDPARCTGKLNNKNLPQGLWTCTFPSGKIQFEINYENGLFEGVKREYYESGKVKLEIYYSKGDLNGTAKEYFDDGSVKNEGSFEKGKPAGVHKEYKEDKTMKEQKDYGIPPKKEVSDKL